MLFPLKNNVYRFNTNKARMPALCTCLIIIIALNEKFQVNIEILILKYNFYIINNKLVFLYALPKTHK